MDHTKRSQILFASEVTETANITKLVLSVTVLDAANASDAVASIAGELAKDAA